MLLLLSAALAAPDTAGLEAMVRDLYATVDRMEFGVPAEPADFVAFVADDENKPLILRGAAGHASLVERFAGWKAAGYSAKSSLRDVACHADKRLGVCTLTVEQQILENGAVVAELSLRSTVASRRVGGEWRLIHLHESEAAE